MPAVAKVTGRAIAAAVVGVGLMWAVVGCQSESEPEETTTTTTTTTTEATTTPEGDPTLVPTTKGSLEPAGPGVGDIQQDNIGPGD